MKAKSTGFKNSILKKDVKDIVLEAKKRNLIKPHTEAFKDYPVNKEKHKGKLNYLK